MKIKSLFFIVTTLIFMIGCSSDDGGNSLPENDGGGNDKGDAPVETVDYFPNEEGNVWNYANEMQIDYKDQETEKTSAETLTLTENNEDKSFFESEVNGDAPGVFTTIISKGYLKKNDEQYLFTGNLDFIEVEDLPTIEIPLENVPFFDLKASDGDELYSDEGEFTQEVAFGQLGNFPVLVKYTLTINQAEDYADMEGFETVKSSQIKISNVSIIIQDIPAIGQINLVADNDSDVLISTNYFANNVGLIKNKTTMGLSIIDLNDVVPFPIDGLPELGGTFRALITQDLIDYNLNE